MIEPKLVFALGNPGKEYENTPHNAGFHFLDLLKAKFAYRKDLQVADWKNEDLFKAEISKVRQEGEIFALLAKPTTFMNLAGQSIQSLVNKNNFDSDNIILVHDDLDIKLGSYKIQFEKAPKDHNGIISVENALGYKKFWRVRIGVEGRDENQRKYIPGHEYVLKKANSKEAQLLNEACEQAVIELIEQFFSE